MATPLSRICFIRSSLFFAVYFCELSNKLHPENNQDFVISSLKKCAILNIFLKRTLLTNLFRYIHQRKCSFSWPSKNLCPKNFEPEIDRRTFSGIKTRFFSSPWKHAMTREAEDEEWEGIRHHENAGPRWAVPVWGTGMSCWCFVHFTLWSGENVWITVAGVCAAAECNASQRARRNVFDRRTLFERMK